MCSVKLRPKHCPGFPHHCHWVNLVWPMMPGLSGSNAHLVACVARQAHILDHVVLIPLIFANIFDTGALCTQGGRILAAQAV